MNSFHCCHWSVWFVCGAGYQLVFSVQVWCCWLSVPTCCSWLCSAGGSSFYECSSISELCQASLELTESHVVWSQLCWSASAHWSASGNMKGKHVLVHCYRTCEHPGREMKNWRRAADWLDTQLHSEAWSICGQCEGCEMDKGSEMLQSSRELTDIITSSTKQVSVCSSQVEQLHIVALCSDSPWWCLISRTHSQPVHFFDCSVCSLYVL